MSETNLYRRAGDFIWSPDSDAVNATEGVLLRADNMVSDTDGSLALRAGSAVLRTGLGTPGRVHSLYALDMDAGTFRFMGVDNNAWRDNGTTATDMGTFDGSGDLAFGDDAYQVFMARGTTKKKFDGTTVNNWGIAAPSAAPTLTGVTAVTTEIASFDSTESPAFSTLEGTGSFVEGHNGTANGALRLVPDPTTGRAASYKTYASDQDFFDIKGSGGADTDLFDIFVWIEEPKKVDRISIRFGLGTDPTKPFKDDYYYFSFDIDQKDTPIKDADAQAVSAIRSASNLRTSSLTLDQVTQVRTPKDAKDVLKSIGPSAGQRTTFKDSSQESSPAWTHLSLTRAQFKRVGGTTGRDWRTVRAFGVVVVCNSPSDKVVYFDNAVWTGGGVRSLTGTYRVAYRFVRQLLDASGNTIYFEMSPLSPISPDIVLTQQSLQVTIPAAAISGADPQVNQVWIYLAGGFLDTFYRAAITGSGSAMQQVIDDFPLEPTAWDAQDRMQVISIGFGIPGFTPDPTLTVTLNKSELDILIENEMLEPGAVGPPDNILAIAGPWRGRMFLLTTDGWLYVSTSTSPSNYSLYHVIDLRRYGDPQWLVRSGGAIHAGFTKDIIRISGDGEESADRVSVNLFGQPLHIGNPPVDRAVYTDGNVVIYRSADGPAMLTGESVSYIPTGGTSLLWRGQTRHGLAALTTSTGRFRFMADGQLVYMLAPEGQDDPTSVWRLDLEKQRWNRLTHTKTFLSMARASNGALLMGTTDGQVWEFDTGTQDDTSNVTAEILTPITDGGDPLRRKDPIDLQIHTDTGGSVGTLGVYTDGSSTLASTFNFSAGVPTIHRADATGIGAFIKSQFRITGSFSKFILHALNLTYRMRPQHVMVVDTGYITLGNSDLGWITEFEVDANSPSNLSLQVYLDDVLYNTQTITVTPNVRTVYRIQAPRGTKSRRPRVVVKTTAAAGTGSIGFDCYFVRIKTRGSGNQDGGGFQTVWPLGEAP